MEATSWEEQNAFEGRKPTLKGFPLSWGKFFLGGHHIKAQYLLSEVPGYISNGSRAWHHYSRGTDFAGMESVRLVDSYSTGSDNNKENKCGRLGVC